MYGTTLFLSTCNNKLFVFYHLSVLKETGMFLTSGIVISAFGESLAACNNSGVLVAKGRHMKPNTYRTHAFIFSWSSSSAAYGLWVRTNKGVVQDGAYLANLCMQLGLQHLLDIHFMIDWQLSNQGIHWPVPHDHIAGSGWNSSRSCIFLKLTPARLWIFIGSRAQLFSQIIRTSQKIHSSTFRLG